MDAAKNLGIVLLGIAVLIGLFFLAAFFIQGAVWVTVKLTPVVEWANALSFVAAILLIPFSLVRFSRAVAAVSYLIVSYVFGITLWMYGLIVAYALWGTVGIIVGLVLMGVGVVPVAVVASLLHGEWFTVANLIFGVVMTFGTRALAAFLISKAQEDQIRRWRPT